MSSQPRVGARVHALCTVIGLVASASLGLAQSHDDPPRTPWGTPDLQGIWDTRTATPLERPDALADQAFLDAEEAAAFAQQQTERFQRFLALDLNADWIDLFEAGLTEGGRTSLIIDPPNGKLPERTPAGRQRQRALGRGASPALPRGPEDRAPVERCIIRQSVPIRPDGYNSNLQILQTPDHVVVLHEMIHEALIIPLDGRPPLRPSIPQWRGDGRGYWDGESLVVETTNFHPDWTYRGTGPDARIIERFTRVDEATLRYEFTVDDPTSFTRPWTGRFDFEASDGPMYGYACHEGNRSMTLLLEVARAQERENVDGP